MKTKVKQLILDFEANRIELSKVVLELNKFSKTEIDAVLLKTYWNRMSLDEFINLIMIEPIYDWQQLTDEKSKELIVEIFKNISNTAILSKNANALEKRYSKPEGTLADLIFYEGIENPETILEELKKNTITYL